MTKYQPFVGVATWAKEPHRCVRKAVQSRAGYSVCANHARVKVVVFWDRKTPDKFKHRKLK